MRNRFAVLLALACLSGWAGSAAARPAPGLRPGDEVSAWEPIHEAGPHAGTKTCPVCTYLDAPVLLAFARDIAAARELAGPLNAVASAHSSGKLKVVLVVVNGTAEEVRAFGQAQPAKSLMVCRPDPSRRDKQLALYKIDPAAKNAVVLYDDYKVTRAWAGLAPADFPALKAATDRYAPRR